MFGPASAGLGWSLSALQGEETGALSTAARPHVFSGGAGGNRVTLTITGDFMRVDITGEALDPSIVDSFRQALAEGVMRSNMLVLVDLSDFAGGVDWASIHAIIGLAPWGSEAGRASKVAYVNKSVWFSAMIKLTSVLFPKTEHRQFSGVHHAMQWLQRD
jgi:hypothetical protein